MTPYLAAIALTVVLAFLARVARPVPATRRGLKTVGPRDSAADKRGYSLFAVAASAVLIVMAGLRWRRGADYGAYERSYSSEYVLLPWSQMNIFEEPGIRVVAKVARVIYDDPITMFVFASLITVGLTTWTIARQTSHLPLALYLYVTSAAWQGSFNGVRQYVACAVVFAGHRLIMERRFWPYLGVVFIASLFHLSAWVTLLLYWLPRRQLRPAEVGLLLVGALLVLNGYQYVGAVVDTIKEDNVSGGTYFAEAVNPLRILVALAPVALFLMFTAKSQLDKTGLFYANMMYLHALVMLASLNSAYVARFAIYTGVFISVAVPALLNMEDRRLRALLSYAAVLGFGVYWYLETSAVASMNPYRSVFDR